MRKTLKKVINEDIDLDFLFYCYTSILNKSENEFWESTPRKIFSQMDIYNKLNGKENENTKDKTNIAQGETITLKAVQ